MVRILKKFNRSGKRWIALSAAVVMLMSWAYLPAGSTDGVYGQAPVVYAASQAPVILSQSSDATVSPGQNVTFTVKASGSSLSYQWYYKKENMTQWCVWKGHTTAITSASANATWNGMVVCCIVTDGEGRSVTSRPVKMTVKTPLRITAQPKDTVANIGQKTYFEVKAVGSGRLKYQWYYKKAAASAWSKWSKHTDAKTSAIANATWDGMQLRCVITDATGASVTSRSLKITAVAPLKITVQPQDVTLGAGERASFSAGAEGVGLKYQWYYKKADAKGWSLWKNHNTARTYANANATWDGMSVKCIVTDIAGKKAETRAARITIQAVQVPLQITSQPDDVCVSIQSQASFFVVASGAGLKYQWYYQKEGESDWSRWENHTAASVAGTADASWHNMKVKCIVTDSAGGTAETRAVTVAIDTTGYPSDLLNLMSRNKETQSFVLNYPLNKDNDKNAAIDLSMYKNCTSVPLLMQWDERWGYDPLGNGYIANNGCGPTCLSMVSIYVLKDTTLTPRELAKFAVKNKYYISGSGSSWTLMSKGGVKLGMKVYTLPSVEGTVKKYLQKGYPIVANVGPGYFTTDGHYIVLVGYEDGMIRVNDPNSRINSQKLWKFSDIKSQIRNMWLFTK